MKKATVPLLLCLALPVPAHAYCVHNQLRDRDVFVEQDLRVEKLREDRIFRHTLKPGQRQCCFNLDCNPGGRPESPVVLSLRVMGEPAYRCGAPEGSDTITVSGNGTVRVLLNPNARSALPYVVRIRSNDREMVGPSGVSCREIKPKGKP